MVIMTGFILKPNYADLVSPAELEKFEDIILNQILFLRHKDDNGNYLFQGPCDDNLCIEDNSPEYKFIKQVYSFQKLLD